MAKCKAEDIRNEVMNGLVKARSDLKDSNVKLQRIGKIVFKLAKAELMNKVQDNKIDKSLAERLDTLRMSKVEKTAGTIESETSNKEAVPNKAKKYILKTGGLEIPYEVEDPEKMTTLASTNARTGRIRIQKELTTEKVAKYFISNEEVEGVSNNKYLKAMPDDKINKIAGWEGVSDKSKQKDDTMSSNIVDRTTNDITKEAMECANGM